MHSDMYRPKQKLFHGFEKGFLKYFLYNALVLLFVVFVLDFLKQRCTKQTLSSMQLCSFPPRKQCCCAAPLYAVHGSVAFHLRPKRKLFIYREREIYIYIYAFGKSFYPKQVTLHSRYTRMFYQFLTSLEIKPMTY